MAKIQKSVSFDEGATTYRPIPRSEDEVELSERNAAAFAGMRRRAHPQGPVGNMPARQEAAAHYGAAGQESPRGAPASHSQEFLAPERPHVLRPRTPPSKRSLIWSAFTVGWKLMASVVLIFAAVGYWLAQEEGHLSEVGWIASTGIFWVIAFFAGLHSIGRPQNPQAASRSRDMSSFAARNRAFQPRQ
mmetsp:Transcript_46878/g.73138  ORF Transcript_46878/g.73138 Transcript_46878/m.73138 type:complete len:189 (+) Transcript_46878:56-622(+)